VTRSASPTIGVRSANRGGCAVMRTGKFVTIAKSVSFVYGKTVILRILIHVPMDVTASSATRSGIHSVLVVERET